MPSLHREVHFETEICTHLSQHGWLHAKGDAALFDRTQGVFMPDLLAWLEATQPEAWEKLNKTHGTALPLVLAERLRKNLNERGTLDVLRRGVEMLGLKAPLDLAQFKPALALNPAIQARYQANRLRVVQQVKHSPNAPNDAQDLVLFLNGVAVATLELKSNFTQSVQDAVDQYRFDRHPSPKGGVQEPLLAFPGGALVHFAVIRTCTDCGQEHLMGDSADYVEEAAPEAHECVCENEVFELMSGVSVYEGTHDVRWYYIACRCVECNLVGVFADWKCEAGDAAAFLAKV